MATKGAIGIMKELATNRIVASVGEIALLVESEATLDFAGTKNRNRDLEHARVLERLADYLEALSIDIESYIGSLDAGGGEGEGLQAPMGKLAGLTGDLSESNNPDSLDNGEGDPSDLNLLDEHDLNDEGDSPEGSGIDYSQHTVAELRSMAAELDIDLGGASKKAEIIDLLESRLNG